MLNYDGIRRVTALYQHHDFLMSLGRFTCTNALRPLEPEEPNNQHDEKDAANKNEPLVCGLEFSSNKVFPKIIFLNPVVLEGVCDKSKNQFR